MITTCRKDNMKLFIWGAGDKGKRIFGHLKSEDVVAFVDGDLDKIGGKYLGKQVISLEEYIKTYKEHLILIAHADEQRAIEYLHSRDVHNFFVLSDCAAELQEPSVRNYLHEYVVDYLSNREGYIIYGLTLYSILIDRWIYEKYGTHPKIVPQIGIDEMLLQCIKNTCSELHFVSIYKVKQMENIEICNVLPNQDFYIKEFFTSQYKFCDLFDCSSKISIYKNVLLERFKKMHLAQRCFIVATGPSLRMEDLDVLHSNDEVCFSVNSILKCFDKTVWRPTYYVVDDYRAIRNNEEYIDGIAKEAAFVGDSYPPFWEKTHNENVYKYHKHYEYSYSRFPKFSEDFSQRSYLGMTVTYTCLQLAIYMGFKEIYLLGVDCNYKKGSTVNYFHSEKIVDNMNHSEESMILAYKAAKKYADEEGIKIYNATRGGMLEVFERVKFDDLF